MTSLARLHKSRKMGNLKDLASMIPGVGKAIKDIDIDDNAFKKHRSYHLLHDSGRTVPTRKY